MICYEYYRIHQHYDESRDPLIGLMSQYVNNMANYKYL